jgi:RNA polymerase sigma-70 factor, ECF subfamily
VLVFYPNTQHPTSTLSDMSNQAGGSVQRSDEEILRLFGQGGKQKEQAFRWLMTQYRERLYWHIRRMVVDHNDTDDVLQNTFVKAWRGLETFEGKSKLYTWLYRIATNESLTFLEQKRRHQVSSFEDISNTLSQQMRADAWFDGDEAQLKLREATAQLPEKQRIVFNMRYYDEMPYEQMSTVLDTSVGALKASFHHAVRKIENLLTQQL